MKLSSVRIPGPFKRLSPFGIGVLFIATAIVAGVVLFNKNAIFTALRPGETIDIRFAANKGLIENLSQAKVAWVPVGVVSDVERQHDGTVLVSVKVDEGTKDKLGSEPSAVIRPTTLLGGNYFVDLVPGGDRTPDAFAGSIPLNRTRLPVELDKVASALQPNVLKGAQGTIRRFDKTLGEEGRAAIREFAEDAPSALAPTGEMLTALQGTRPRTDLTHVVSGLENTARVLTAQQGQLDSVISGLKQTTGVLSGRSTELSSALETMPSTLDSTRAGLSRLDVTLGKLRDTAEPARPIARELATTLEHLDPVLAKSRPVVRDLTDLMADAQPLVERLNP
ncbi:MAG: MlaD family protein, partial [Thermocrispum sp.]